MTERIYSYCPFDVRVGMGLVPGFNELHKFGRNPDVDSAAAEDIWTGGGLYVWATEAQKVDVVSTDVQDAAAGNGIATVELQGLDSSYAAITETIALDGTTPVRSVAEFLRLFRIICRQPGSAAPAANPINKGNITATQVVSAIKMAEVLADGGQTLMAVYTVPLGQQFLMSRMYVSLGKQASGAGNAALYARPFGESFQIKHVLGAHSQGATEVDAVFVPPVPFAARTDLVLRCEVTSNNHDVNGGFDGVLYETGRFIVGN